MSLLTLTKSTDKDYAVVGENITYSIVVKNDTNMPLSHVIIYDMLCANLQFIEGSLSIDGVLKPEENILSGVNLGDMTGGESHTLKFQAKILDTGCKEVANTAQASFSYTSIGGIVQQGSSESNTEYVIVYNVELTIDKQANKQQVMLNDVVTYIVKLSNTGDLDIQNVLFKDYLPVQAVLIPGSFKVDGRVINGVDLQQGIVVGNISVGHFITVEYQVEVIGTNCSGMLTNEAMGSFSYRLPNGIAGKAEAVNETQRATIYLDLSTFKQLSIESYLDIPLAKPDIEALNSVTGTIDQVTCHVISTITSTSTEGQRLTGYKLSIRGQLNLSVEYTALEETQSVHSAHYAIPFSTFIVLPPNYTVGSKLEISGLVEDIYYKMINIRSFFVNVTSLMNVKILGC